jgi:glycerol-3-phosphate O-acyltransferase 3/4
MEGTDLVGKIVSTWLTLVLSLILLPSAFGVSLGISEIYMKILVKTLEVSTREEAAPLSPAALGGGGRV